MNDIGQPPPATVTEIGHSDIAALLGQSGPPRQAMRGFDPEYVDIVDYIIRCTHRIWEEKAIGLIYSHYRHNAVIYTPMGTVVGREAVVASTLQTLLAFPDRRLYGEAVIWSGDDVRGFYSSHRITNTGTNLGPTAWGPPTGRRCTWRGIADCRVAENRIFEEWLVRDDMHLLHQLGFDAATVARALARAELDRGAVPPLPSEVTRAMGQLPPAQPPLDEAAGPEAFVAWHLGEIWNGRMLNRVRDLYAPTAVCHAPVGRQLRGWNEITSVYLALLAALPDGVVSIDHVSHIDEASRGTSVAVRWTLSGTHVGPGLFGPPSGTAITMMGISHYRLADNRVAEEWMVFDELSVLKQIAMKAG